MVAVKKSYCGGHEIKTQLSDSMLHILTNTGIINIYLDLTDENGNPVTHISVIPDSSDVNGSPINVVCLDQNDNVIRDNPSIRMVLDKTKTYKQLTLNEIGDIIIA